MHARRWAMSFAGGLVTVLAAVAHAGDLTEGNAASWGTFASDARATSVTDATDRVKAGAQSLKFVTASGFDTGVRYPGTGQVHIDASGASHFTFWAYAINSAPSGFQGNQPVVLLKCAGGDVRLAAASIQMTGDSWRHYFVPLAGSSSWTRTTTGTPDLADVQTIEIHHDTWDFGFTIYYDGVDFIAFTPAAAPPAGPAPPAGVDPDVIRPRVLVFGYDPIWEHKGGKRLHEVYGWREPAKYGADLADVIRTYTHGRVDFQVVESTVVDEYWTFKNGATYDDLSYEAMWQARSFHSPGFDFDYVKFIADHGIAARVESGDLDEVWIMGPPDTGMYESTIAGDGGYWCNSGPVRGVPCRRAFVLMGLNYERGIGCALHSHGHRIESIMSHQYGNFSPARTDAWSRFTRYDKVAPGKAGVGLIHFPPNGTSDYDYLNTTVVVSDADDWYSYPNLTGTTRSFNSTEWNSLAPGGDCGDAYMRWWFDHLPHAPGRGPDDYLCNWWRYVADVDQFKAWDGNLYFSSGIPVTTLAEPDGSGPVTGIVRVRANSQADGALGRTDLYVDGAYHSSDTLAPFTFSWDTSALEGSHVLVSKAYELQSGTEAVSAPVTVIVGNPPYAPAALAATPAPGLGALLAWQDLSSAESAFEIERAAAGGDFAAIGSAAADAAAYLDSRAPRGVECSYRVRSSNEFGGSDWIESQPVRTAGGLVAKRAIARPAKHKAPAAFDASGVLELGGGSFTPPAAVTVELGALRLQLAAVAPDGLVWTAPGARLALTAPKSGGSLWSFVLHATGEVAAEGELAVGLVLGDRTVRGSLVLHRGKFALGSKQTPLRAPDLQITGLRASRPKTGHDTLTLRAVFAAPGAAPAELPDVHVILGDVFALDVPSAGFRRTGPRLQYGETIDGVRVELTLDYAAGSFELTARDPYLSWPDGESADLACSISIGALGGECVARVAVGDRTIEY